MLEVGYQLFDIILIIIVTSSNIYVWVAVGRPFEGASLLEESDLKDLIWFEFSHPSN